jgi:hypothetical protein
VIEPTSQARNLLAAWETLLGGDLPKPLAAASAALDAVTYTLPPPVTVDGSKITAANAESTVSGLASRMADEAKFELARNRAQDGVSRHVLAVAKEVVPDLLASIEPRFRQAVDTFTDTLDLLPENLTSDALVSAGPAAVEAFGVAKAAEAELNAIDSWVASLSDLYGYRADPCLRLATASTRQGLQTLLRAEGKTGTVKPLWVAIASTPDVSWVLNTPDQSAEIRRVLDALPPTEQKKPVFVSFT